MAGNAGAALKRDEVLEETDEAAIRAAVQAALMQVHTAMPGIVKSFDPASQTATVQPALQREYVDLGAMALPPVPKVPVLFLGGGGNALTFPVAPGDECLLVFSERAIDNWFQAGGVRDVSDHRFHDLTDGFAIVGFRSLPHKLSDFVTDGFELRGTGYLGGKAGARPVLAPDMVGALTPLTKIWLNAVGSATGAGPFPADALTTLIKAM